MAALKAAVGSPSPEATLGHSSANVPHLHMTLRLAQPLKHISSVLSSVLQLVERPDFHLLPPDLLQETPRQTSPRSPL